MATTSSICDAHRAPADGRRQQTTRPSLLGEITDRRSRLRKIDAARATDDSRRRRER